MKEMINQVFNEDCLETMKRIPDKSINVIPLDLPFGTTNNHWDILIPLDPLWEELNRIIKDDGIIFAFSTQPFTTDIINSNRKYFRHDIIWNKVLPVGFLNANKMVLRSHENISIFYKSLPYYKPLMSQGHDRKVVPKRSGKNNNCYGNFESVEKYDSTERHPTSIMTIEETNEGEVVNTLLQRLSKYEPDTVQTYSNGGNRTKIIHPTEKPLELALNFLRMYAKEGFTIFDPTAGSGVFLEAAKSLGLDYIGCEKDKYIYKKIVKRLSAVQGSLF